MPQGTGYPTAAHARAAEAILGFFEGRAGVDAVLLTNSCARGQATPESWLDMAVLVPPGADWPARLEPVWADFHASEPAFAALRGAGRFSVVHLDFVDGELRPSPRDLDSGPDWFEVEIG